MWDACLFDVFLFADLLWDDFLWGNVLWVVFLWDVYVWDAADNVMYPSIRRWDCGFSILLIANRQEFVRDVEVPVSSGQSISWSGSS